MLGLKPGTANADVFRGGNDGPCHGLLHAERKPARCTGFRQACGLRWTLDRRERARAERGLRGDAGALVGASAAGCSRSTGSTPPRSPTASSRRRSSTSCSSPACASSPRTGRLSAPGRSEFDFERLVRLDTLITSPPALLTTGLGVLRVGRTRRSTPSNWRSPLVSYLNPDTSRSQASRPTLVESRSGHRGGVLPWALLVRERGQPGRQRRGRRPDGNGSGDCGMVVVLADRRLRALMRQVRRAAEEIASHRHSGGQPDGSACTSATASGPPPRQIDRSAEKATRWTAEAP